MCYWREDCGLREEISDCEEEGYRVTHKLVYWWGDPIPIHPWQPGDDPAGRTFPEYFAITIRNARMPDLPFDYEPIATLNMDRTRSDSPEIYVLVARRTSPPNITEATTP